MRYAIAIDAGGTTVKGGIVSETGVLVARHRLPTPSTGLELIDTAAELVKHFEALIAAGEVEGIDGAEVQLCDVIEPVGLAVPGIVDESSGQAVLSVNLGWRDLPLRSLAAQRLGRPVAFGHDVRCGALAEARWGAGIDNCLYVAIGTGISGALIMDGKPIMANAWAGEIGQATAVDPADPTRTITIERLCSAGAIARRYKRRNPGVIPEDAGAAEVWQMAATGDRVAITVIEEAIETLARILSICVCLVGTVRIVIGGGMAEAGEALLMPLRLRLANRLTVLPAPEVVAAKLGSWSQTMGSGANAFDLASQLEAEAQAEDDIASIAPLNPARETAAPSS